MENERRSQPRQRTLLGARIVVNDGFSTFTCTVHNLSSAGARLTLPSVIGIPDRFQLVVYDGRKFDCVTVWKHDEEIGVKFIAAQPDASPGA